MQQERLMRTYRVGLLDANADEIGTTDVNLSFMVDAHKQPITPNGNPLGEVDAMAELTKRLRKLARNKRVQVTTEQLDAADDFSVKLVRWRFVTVEVDDSGRPTRTKQ